MHMTSVSQGQRVILHLRFQNKTFICCQCNQNYISTLIKFNNQITEVKHILLMRILLYCNSTTYWLFNVPVHAILEYSVANLQESLQSHSRLQAGRQQFIDIAAARVALPPLPLGRDHGRRNSTACRKFVANPSKPVNSFFEVSSKSTTMYSKFYCIFYLM